MVNRGLVVFGIVALLVGVGAGYAMYAYPQGLNPDWPLWMALLAPAAFVFVGLHLVSSGLGYPRFSGATLTAIAICLGAIGNWAAFNASHVQCVEIVSFLGVEISRRSPSASECQIGLRAVVVSIDGMGVLALVAFLWRKRLEPGSRRRS
jgi:hypothetical protein